MDGIADMGGTEGWGPVHPPRDDEPVFEKTWQGRAFALGHFSMRLSGWNMDAFRHAIERLDRSAYLDDGYYGRWLNGTELMLTESAVLAPDAIDARARNLRGEHVGEPPVPEPAAPAAPRPPRARYAPWTPLRPSPWASGCAPGTCHRPGTPGCRVTCAGTPESST
ncbi:hypothetical protein ACFQX6_16535 [Streptosporangium lutulentum]